MILPVDHKLKLSILKAASSLAPVKQKLSKKLPHFCPNLFKISTINICIMIIKIVSISMSVSISTRSCNLPVNQYGETILNSITKLQPGCQWQKL